MYKYSELTKIFVEAALNTAQKMKFSEEIY